ncbi:MAG: 50S ribosomal protein L4, partial [Patescibacteria group bacterium]
AKFFDEPGLLVVGEANAKMARFVRNLPRMAAVGVDQLTVVDVLTSKRVWIDESALSTLERRCKK